MSLYKIDIVRSVPNIIDANFGNTVEAEGIIMRNFKRVGTIFYTIGSALEDHTNTIVLFEKDEDGAKFYADAKKAYKEHSKTNEIKINNDNYTVWFAEFLMEKFLNKSLAYKKFDAIISGRALGFTYKEM